MHATTIIARNYLAHARVWADSFTRHHPQTETSVLIVDDHARKIGSGEDFEVLRPDDIGIPRREFHRMAALYTVLELSTALKPWLLRTLLDRGHDAALYFDPDIRVFHPLNDLFALTTAHSLVLTPHITEPLPDDDLLIDERTIRLAGTFNLGFVGVSGEARKFLGWWGDRLARGCRIATDQGQFVDQRYVDLVPGLFEHEIIRDPTLNVAYWNVHQRPLDSQAGTYTVDGRPLRFFHFSGFDPSRSWLLSTHGADRPRVLLSEHPILARLCKEYADALQTHGYGELAALEYGFDRLPNGLRLDATARAAYASALERSEASRGLEPPNPFEPGESERFVAWLKEAPPGLRLPRYLRSLYDQRPVLWPHFPDAEGVHARPFVEWASTTGVRDEQLEPGLLITPTQLAEREARKAVPPPSAQGANLVGYLTAELGVGEAARQLAGCLDTASVPYSSIVYDRTSSRLEHAFTDCGLTGARYDTNLICVNADALPEFVRTVGPSFFADRVNIGIWWWEVTRIPESWRAAFDLVDEVWVGSRFVQQVLEEVATVPIWAYPMPLAFPAPPERSRADLNLPEGFLFLYSFDFFSTAARKNPGGVVDAFTHAFADGEGPQLVVKSINGAHHRVALEELRARAAGRSDVAIIDGYLSPGDRNALMASCDAYVSLHRSEGFGLTLAEAMWNGKPVVATAYGGNTDFMTNENAYLVPHTIVEIGKGADPYPADGTWAEPSIEAAAHLLRRIVEQPEEASSRAERGRREIKERHAPKLAARMIQERLELLRESTRRRTQETAAVPSAPSALERAAISIEHGPANAWDSPSQFGILGQSARRLLRRVLRPYEQRQRELDATLVQALLELNHLTVHLSNVLAPTTASSEEQASTFKTELGADPELPAIQRQDSASLRRTEATPPSSSCHQSSDGPDRDSRRSVRASIVVCTRNRAGRLGACLAHLADQTLAHEIEVVVVDNGSTDATADVVDAWCRNAPGHRRSVLEPGASLSRARNRGVAEAQGDVVLFIDDDALAPRGWAEAHAAAYDRDPQIVAVGGPVSLRWPDGRPPWAARRLEHWFSALDHGFQTIDFPRPHGPYGTNMSVRRAALDAAGGFDERLGRHGRSLLSSEEADLFERLWASGGRIAYEPTALVFHSVTRDRLSRTWVIRRGWAQGRTNARRRLLDGPLPRDEFAAICRTEVGAAMGGLGELMRSVADGHPGVALDDLARRCGHAAAVVEHWWLSLHPDAPSVRPTACSAPAVTNRHGEDGTGDPLRSGSRSTRRDAAGVSETYADASTPVMERSCAEAPRPTVARRRDATSVSVCCMTADPSVQVAAALITLRPVVDEIVLAVDSRVDPVSLSAYSDVADRVIRFEFRSHIDRPRAWLAKQCSGAWLLSIDGDEVPSRALVDALPELVAATDVIQYWLPRRWLYPDADTWLGELPWWPDFQLRLVRNDATLAARSELHAGFVSMLPSRHVDAPLYHLDCILTDADERAVKAERYDVEAPGRMAYGGGSLNEVMYSPERWVSSPGRPVPIEDRLTLNTVLASRARPIDTKRVVNSDPISLVTAAEIDEVASSPVLDDTDYAARLWLFGGVDTRLRLCPAEVLPLYTWVENRGQAVWRWGRDQQPEIRVSYHWRSIDGRMIEFEGLRSPLPCTVSPGGSTIVPVWLKAPFEPGTYILELDLVHEHMRWFGSPLTIETIVAERVPNAR